MENVTEKQPILRSCLAIRIKNIDGKLMGKDGKPMRTATRNVHFHNDKDESLVQGASSDPVQAVDSRSVSESATHDGSSQDKPTENPNFVSLNTSYFADVLNSNKESRKLKFRALLNPEQVANADFVLPLATLTATQQRFQKVIKDENGLFFFKFASLAGLEQGPWLIRNMHMILTKWSPNLSLTKDKVTKVLVWVKLHKVPVVAYSKDGLSLIATQIGQAVMLDTFTSTMCADPWGRMGYDRALIEVSADKELKQEVIMAVPEVVGMGHTNVNISVEYELKPPLCHECHVLGHNLDQCPKLVVDTAKVAPVDQGNDRFTMINKPRSTFIYRPKVSEPARMMETKKENIDLFKLKNQFDSLRSQDDTIVETELGESSMMNEVTANRDTHSESEVEEIENHMWIFLLFLRSVLRFSDHGTGLLMLIFAPKASGKQLFYSFVYASNSPSTRRILSAELGMHKLVTRGVPWTLMGDFNVALNLEDYSSSSSKLSSTISEFKYYVYNIEVLDITSSGLHFTWNQKPKGEGGLLKKLDRVLGNTDFIDAFLGSYALFQPYRISDHSPAVLYIPNLPFSKPKPFLKLLQDHGNLHIRVNKLRVELDTVQKALDLNPNDVNLRDEEAVYVQAFVEAKLDEERFLKQKAKIRWLDCGDFRTLLKEINHTFLALIPKVPTPLKVADFRPISCCNVIYKCISKILTNHIIKGVKVVVSDNQSAFVPGRRISDNILITQELMHNYHQNRGPPQCAFMIDIQKAYDMVNKARVTCLLDTADTYTFVYHRLLDPTEPSEGENEGAQMTTYTCQFLRTRSHQFPDEEQPLPHVDSPTAESPGHVTESDPEEDPEMDEDNKDEDVREEEHYTPVNSTTVIPVG
ncbi:trichome birefringence-like protein 3 [Tanacetum coccineum]